MKLQTIRARVEACTQVEHEIDVILCHALAMSRPFDDIRESLGYGTMIRGDRSSVSPFGAMVLLGYASLLVTPIERRHSALERLLHKGRKLTLLTR